MTNNQNHELEEIAQDLRDLVDLTAWQYEVVNRAAAALSTQLPLSSREVVGYVDQATYDIIKQYGSFNPEISIVPTETKTIALCRCDAPAQRVAGQWVRCTPDLLNAGVSCANTPRRPGDGTYSHDHFIAHAAPIEDVRGTSRERQALLDFIFAMDDTRACLDTNDEKLRRFSVKRIEQAEAKAREVVASPQGAAPIQSRDEILETVVDKLAAIEAWGPGSILRHNAIQAVRALQTSEIGEIEKS